MSYRLLGFVEGWYIDKVDVVGYTDVDWLRVVMNKGIEAPGPRCSSPPYPRRSAHAKARQSSISTVRLNATKPNHLSTCHYRCAVRILYIVPAVFFSYTFDLTLLFPTPPPNAAGPHAASWLRLIIIPRALDRPRLQRSRPLASCPAMASISTFRPPPTMAVRR